MPHHRDRKFRYIFSVVLKAGFLGLLLVMAPVSVRFTPQQSTMPVSISFTMQRAYACCTCCTNCQCLGETCCHSQICTPTSNDETGQRTDDIPTTTLGNINVEFIKHRDWIIQILWEAHVLPAMMLMTQQLSAVAMQQVQIVGSLLDAKHQLETQQLIQELHVVAHKDYQVSQGVCEIGTNIKSLAASNRNAEFSAQVLARRSLQRQLLSGDAISAESLASDRLSRLNQFMTTYCNPGDNGEGLDLLCGGGGPAERRNKDVDFTATIDTPETLEIDFAEGATATGDEEDVFALAANLYGHTVPPQLPEVFLADQAGNPKLSGASSYMDLRAIAAKRSVAHNAFASIAAMKAQGGTEVQPYMQAILQKMGVPSEQITEMLGTRPSYFMQMEMLTRKLYQNPTFYTELYDTPANVDRKRAAMQAIELMQKRDMFHSMLRGEAIMSVWLELELTDEQDKIKDEIDRLDQAGGLDDAP